MTGDWKEATLHTDSVHVPLATVQQEKEQFVPCFFLVPPTRTCSIWPLAWTPNIRQIKHDV